MKRLGLLLPNLKVGGIAKVAAQLSMRFSSRLQCNFLLFSDEVEQEFKGNIIDLGVSGAFTFGGSPQELEENLSEYANIIRDAKRLLELEATLSFSTMANVLNCLSRTEAERVILSSHAVLSHSRPARTERNARHFDKIIRRSYPLADTVIALTEKMGTDLVENWSVSDNNMTIIPPGIDVKQVVAESLIRPDWTRSYLTQAPSIIAVSEFRPAKDHKSLVVAFDRIRTEFPKLNLAFVGDGPERRSVELLTSKLGVRNVNFFGTRANPMPILSDSTIFALPSFREGLPLALLEALCLGIPAVAADCPTGPREILAPNGPGEIRKEGVEICEYGVLVHRGDNFPHRLADAFRTLLGDEKLLQLYRRRGPLRAAEYDIVHISSLWENALCI